MREVKSDTSVSTELSSQSVGTRYMFPKGERRRVVRNFEQIIEKIVEEDEVSRAKRKSTTRGVVYFRS